MTAFQSQGVCTASWLHVPTMLSGQTAVKLQKTAGAAMKNQRMGALGHCALLIQQLMCQQQDWRNQWCLVTWTMGRPPCAEQSRSVVCSAGPVTLPKLLKALSNSCIRGHNGVKITLLGSTRRDCMVQRYLELSQRHWHEDLLLLFGGLKLAFRAELWGMGLHTPERPLCGVARGHTTLKKQFENENSFPKTCLEVSIGNHTSRQRSKIWDFWDFWGSLQDSFSDVVGYASQTCGGSSLSGLAVMPFTTQHICNNSIRIWILRLFVVGVSHKHCTTLLNGASLWYVCVQLSCQSHSAGGFGFCNLLGGGVLSWPRRYHRHTVTYTGIAASRHRGTKGLSPIGPQRCCL